MFSPRETHTKAHVRQPRHQFARLVVVGKIRAAERLSCRWRVAGSPCENLRTLWPTRCPLNAGTEEQSTQARVLSDLVRQRRTVAQVHCLGGNRLGRDASQRPRRLIEGLRANSVHALSARLLLLRPLLARPSRFRLRLIGNELH